MIRYLGNKRKHAAAILRCAGVSGPPDEVWLNEPGQIGALWERLVNPPTAADDVARLRAWDLEDPAALRPRLVEASTVDPIAWLLAATWCFRPGQIESSAVLPGATPRRDGRARWSRPPARTVAVNVEAVAALLAGTRVTRLRAQDVPIPPDARRWLVYIDPPYAGTQGYAVGFPRADVVAVARAWAAAGAHVLVSEGARIAELEGWYAREITAERESHCGGGGVYSLGQRIQTEWIHSNHPLQADPRGPLFDVR